MSASSTSDLEAWCTKARGILGAKSKPSSAAVKAEFTKLQSKIIPTQPDELNDTEWAAYLQAHQNADEALNKGDAKTKPLKPIPSMAQFAFENLVGEIDTAVAIIKKREASYTDAQHHGSFALLSAAGQAKVKKLDAPRTALDGVEIIVTRLAAIRSDLGALAGMYDTALSDPLFVAADAELAKLDLAAAETIANHLDKILADARQEEAEVNALKGTHGGAGDAPVDVAGWRELAKRERDFADLTPKIQAAITAGANALTPGGAPLVSKRQQVTAIRGPIEAQIGLWPGKSVTEKRVSSTAVPGTIAWFQERLDTLRAPTSGNPADIEAALVAVEWQDFLDDVVHQWGVYAASGFNKNSSGRDATKAVLTPRVRTKYAVTASFNAGGRTYTKAPSNTTAVSYHTPMPKGSEFYNTAGQLRKSFVYHI